MRRGIFVFPEERVRRFRIRQSAVDFYDSYVFRPAIRRASPVTIREYFPKVNIVDSWWKTLCTVFRSERNKNTPTVYARRDFNQISIHTRTVNIRKSNIIYARYIRVSYLYKKKTNALYSKNGSE